MPATLLAAPAPSIDDLVEFTNGELDVALYVSSLVINRSTAFTREDGPEMVGYALEGLSLLGRDRLIEWGRRLNGFWNLYSRDLETAAVLRDHRSRFPSMLRLKKCVGATLMLTHHLEQVRPERRNRQYPRRRPIIDFCPCGGSGTLHLPNGLPMACPAHSIVEIETPRHLAVAA
jgi:hypothetical protein